MTVTRSESETFSSVDAAWLHMDTPTNLAIITGVLSFKEPLDYERLKATLEHRLLIHSRFRQRVRESNIPLGLPSWEYDPDFDLEEHLQRCTLPEPGGHDELQQLAGGIFWLEIDGGGQASPILNAFLYSVGCLADDLKQTAGVAYLSNRVAFHIGDYQHYI